MKKVTLAVIGAGGRGLDYASYTQGHPQEAEVVAFADPDAERHAYFKNLYHIRDELAFWDYKDLLAQPRLCDAVLITTQDRLHFDPAIRALEKGYHILLEKPMASDPLECILLAVAAEQHSRILNICHVLRYVEFFQVLKALVAEGCIGRLVSIQHNENVGFWHQALSFVRGPWRNAEQATPMIVAKCCHDMDILLWLAGADCTYVASFGSLLHFRKENCPPGAPAYCQDGCPHEDICPYFAPAYYLENWTADFAFWAFGVTQEMTIEEKLQRLRASPHGRCVYQSDNNVVDHQVVSLEFANGVTAAFTMCAFTNECTRTIKLMGTQGEIRGNMEKLEIELTTFQTGKKDTIRLKPASAGHGGGDYNIMRDFVRIVRDEDLAAAKTSARVSVQSHLMAFAAEKARLERRVIDLNAYERELKDGKL